MCLQLYLICICLLPAVCCLVAAACCLLCVQINEVRGMGDTFDVSWSTDGTMLSSCFSSGAINIMLVN